MSKRRFFASRPARKSSQPRAFRFETLEVRELMAVMKGSAAAAAPPAKGGTVQTAQTGTANTDNGGKVTMPATPFLIPALSSNPGAPATLYLDFNGHYQHETVLDDTLGPWGGMSDFYTAAYDMDGDVTRFTTVELEEIRAVWASVAEDYAPFNINVTTVEPYSFSHASQNLRVAIGGTDFRSGKDMLGVADHNAFNEEGSPNIVHVFSRGKDGSRRNLQDVADAASHEAGHAYGLMHQSTFNSSGVLVEEYRKGDKLRSPIMGAHAGAKRATWSHGTTGAGLVWSLAAPGGFATYSVDISAQDDMAILAGSENGFGYRTDDHSGNFATAASFRTENTPGLFASGIIGTTADKDVFRFETSGGNVSILLTLPEYYGVNMGNLDATLKLYNAQQQLVAVDSDATLLGNITQTLAAGTYYLEVGSQGNYGDVGQYKLAVTETVGAKVVSSTYESLSATQGGVWVTFNEPINALTFTTADVKINGGAAGAGVLSVEAVAGDPKKFLVKVTKPKGSATPQMSISVGPQINDLFGNAMNQNGNGKNGEAADSYFANLGLGVVPPVATTAALSPKKTGAPKNRR